MQQQAGHNKTGASKRVGCIDPKLEMHESEKLMEMTGNT